MTTVYMIGKYLLLIPILAITKLLVNNAPVSSQEIGNTIGLPYGTWIFLFLVAICFTVLFIAMLVTDLNRNHGGMHEHKAE